MGNKFLKNKKNNDFHLRSSTIHILKVGFSNIFICVPASIEHICYCKKSTTFVSVHFLVFTSQSILVCTVL